MQFVATEKTDLKAYRWYFPSLPPLPPLSLPPSFGHSPPRPLEKLLARKTGINSLRRKNSNLCESLHEFLKHSLKTGNIVAFLTTHEEKSFSFIVLGNPFSWGWVALCGGRRGPDGCSCCDVKMTLAAWEGLAYPSTSSAGMGMGLLLLLLRRAYPAYATPGQYDCRPTRSQACTSRPTMYSISLHFDLVYIKHINVMNQNYWPIPFCNNKKCQGQHDFLLCLNRQ